jgi:hypothetical protein
MKCLLEKRATVLGDNHEMGRIKHGIPPTPLTMFLVAPNRSFTHCRYSIKHEEHPNSSKAFSVEDWRKCVHVKCSHEPESTEDSQRTRNHNGHSVLWKAVSKRSICQRSAWRGKSIVPSFGPTQSELHQKSFFPWKSYQNPVKLSILYRGPKRAGLLLYRSNNCKLVQMI